MGTPKRGCCRGAAFMQAALPLGARVPPTPWPLRFLQASSTAVAPELLLAYGWELIPARDRVSRACHSAVHWSRSETVRETSQRNRPSVSASLLLLKVPCALC